MNISLHWKTAIVNREKSYVLFAVLNKLKWLPRSSVEKHDSVNDVVVLFI